MRNLVGKCEHNENGGTVPLMSVFKILKIKLIIKNQTPGTLFCNLHRYLIGYQIQNLLVSKNLTELSIFSAVNKCCGRTENILTTMTGPPSVPVACQSKVGFSYVFVKMHSKICYPPRSLKPLYQYYENEKYY
jgi:hypothetical protein